MRLFFYYALHSFINQVRKLLKTWVLLFILCCGLIGGLIGAALGSLSESKEESAVVEEEEEPPVDEEMTEAIDNIASEASQLEPYAMLELAAGALILIVFLFNAYSADKSGNKIFLPADVNLLFSSPMKPQSVLLFRLMTKIGFAILFSFYFIFELQVIVSSLGLSAWSVFSVLLTWFLILATGKLLQIFLYTLCSTRSGFKKHIRRTIYGVCLVLVALYAVYYRQSGLDYLPAADRLFNAPFTRFIPVWGWLKGFCLYSVEGKLLPALIFAGLDLAFIVLLAYIIWHMKADFYEDAMAKSEEIAEIMDAAASSESSRSFMIRRSKERSERIKRDGLDHGAGAVMYFYKPLYNRFRFAHLGFFTKTSETYLVAAACVYLLSRFVLEPGGHGGPKLAFTLTALVIAGFSFFRALGNPLGQDTENVFFRMVPESSFKKLFYSIAGGSVNCLLDILIALIPAAILLKADPLTMLAWAFFIVSIDFYATTVGTFIDLSVPISAGKMVKQLAQIMFIYFGLLPDAALLYLGYYLDRFPAFCAISVFINLLLGLVFLSLTPKYLEPRSRPYREPVVRTAQELATVRHRFSLLGFGPFLILVVTAGLQALALLFLKDSPLLDTDWAVWVLNFAPMYLIAVPLGMLFIRKAPAETQEKRKLSVKNFLAVFCICIFLMYAGSILGTLVTMLLNLILPKSSVTNPLETLISQDSLFWRILVMVILAPLVEEFLFRKQLIDRMRSYGEKRAVILSALMFGLFHGNFSQMFYAFLLGLVFGYIYLRTGRLRYTVLLHMIVNFMGSVIAPFLLERLDLNALEQMPASQYAQVYGSQIWLILGYMILLLLLFFAGLILLCWKSRQVSFAAASQELPAKKGFSVSCVNVGMILFLAGCLGMTVVSLL